MRFKAGFKFVIYLISIDYVKNGCILFPPFEAVFVFFESVGG